jgi:hypothetical protein
VPFNKAKVTLSWEEKTRSVIKHPRRVVPKEIVLNFRPKSLTQEMYCSPGIHLHSNHRHGDLHLQIVAYLDVDEDNSLASDCGARLNDDYLSDIKVIAGQSSFNCHKIILASRSDVFAAMFSHANVKECVNRELIFEDNPTIVEHFLNFLYTDKVKGGLDENSAVKLLFMGDQYNVQKLKKTCHHFLAVHMDTDNCCTIMITAHLTHCNILEEECCTFISENVAQVKETEGWAEIGRDHPKLFQVILEKKM